MFIQVRRPTPGESLSQLPVAEKMVSPDSPLETLLAQDRICRAWHFAVQAMIQNFLKQLPGTFTFRDVVDVVAPISWDKKAQYQKLLPDSTRQIFQVFQEKLNASAKHPVRIESLVGLGGGLRGLFTSESLFRTCGPFNNPPFSYPDLTKSGVLHFSPTSLSSSQCSILHSRK